MIQILFFLTLLQISKSQTAVGENGEQVTAIGESLCMTNFMAVDHNKFQSEEAANLISDDPNNNKTPFFYNHTDHFDCYNYLPNYESIVHGYNIYSECYIPYKYLIVDKGGHLINRCGQWLQVVGPSQQRVICMIAGAHGVTMNGFDDVEVISLSTSMFEGLTPSMTQATTYMTPVVVAETDFDLKINPSLWVRYTKEGVNTLHFVNMNVPIEKIAMEGMEYQMEINNTFAIKYKEKRLITISLIGFNKERIDFKDVDLGNKTDEIPQDKEVMFTEFKTQSRFVNSVLTYCNYLAENFIYNKGGYKKNLFMHWVITKADVDGDKKPISEKIYYSNKDQNFTIDLTHNTFSLTFSLSPSATVFSSAFKYLEISMKANFDVTKYNHIQTIASIPEDTTILQTLLQTHVENIFPTKYYVDPETNMIYIKVIFRKNNRAFTDALTIYSEVKDLSLDGDKLYSMDVINATLVRLDEYASQHECTSQAFGCHGTECTIDPDDYVEGVSPWESSHCIGACGVCNVGYKCNASGLCDKIISKNTRSGTSSLLILSILLILLILF